MQPCRSAPLRSVQKNIPLGSNKSTTVRCPFLLSHHRLYHPAWWQCRRLWQCNSWLCQSWLFSFTLSLFFIAGVYLVVVSACNRLKNWSTLCWRGFYQSFPSVVLLSKWISTHATKIFQDIRQPSNMGLFPYIGFVSCVRGLINCWQVAKNRCVNESVWSYVYMLVCP